MGIKVANNAFATLAAGISNSDTSITVSTGQGARFPALGAGDYFYATLINTSNQLEIVECTARSGDVLTVVRAQESTAARAYDVGDRIEIRITAATFEDATAIYDVDTASTGFLAMPSGTTAQRPGSAEAGYSRFNSDGGSLEFFDGTNWIATNLIPTVNSVDGTIFAGAASALTLSLTNATDTITVRFSEDGSTLADVTPVTVTSDSASVTVPSAVFNRPAATVIAVSILNQDGTPSSNAVNKTVAALPTGGTITTSGGFRIHTFTSSSSLVVPSGLTLSNVEYLVVAGGGGGGGARSSPGGGAGGYRTSVVGATSGGNSSAETRLNLVAGSYTATVGAAASASSNGSNSVFSTITAIGGGGGLNTVPGSSGGSGAGGSGNDGVNAGGSGTSGQGRNGGAGSGTNGLANNGAGGGGGAAGVGLPGGSPAGGPNGGGGAGGGGLASSITGSSVIRAGGGGGTGHPTNSSSGAGGAGGAGGGGAGNQNGVGGNGSVNTGSGGGSGSSAGGSGGSGIVIVRYAFPF